MSKKSVTKHLEKITHRTSAHVIYVEIIVGFLLSLGSIILFADIAKDVLAQETQAIDTALSYYVYSFRSPELTPVMIFITMFGAEFTLVIASIISVGLAWRNHKREAILFATILVVGVVLNNILKLIFQRPRPDFDPLMILNSYSFPSGHSMNAFIFYSILSYYIYHFTRKKTLGIIAVITSIIIILLVGISRVYLGVHYPSDVLAGFIGGFFVFILAVILEKTLAFQELVKRVKKRA